MREILFPELRLKKRLEDSPKTLVYRLFASLLSFPRDLQEHIMSPIDLKDSSNSIPCSVYQYSGSLPRKIAPRARLFFVASDAKAKERAEREGYGLALRLVFVAHDILSKLSKYFWL